MTHPAVNGCTLASLVSSAASWTARYGERRGKSGDSKGKHSKSIHSPRPRHLTHKKPGGFHSFSAASADSNFSTGCNHFIIIPPFTFILSFMVFFFYTAVVWWRSNGGGVGKNGLFGL